jgi:hypothetical protein
VNLSRPISHAIGGFAACPAQNVVEKVVLNTLEPKLRPHSNEREQHELVFFWSGVLSIVTIWATEQGITAPRSRIHLMKFRFSGARVSHQRSIVPERGP